MGNNQLDDLISSYQKTLRVQHQKIAVNHSAVEKSKILMDAIKIVLPQIGDDPDKAFLLYVMITLKLEGKISQEMSDEDRQLVKIVQESLQIDNDQKEHILKFTQQTLGSL